MLTSVPNNKQEWYETYVVLGGNGTVEVGVQKGELLENIAADTGDLAEEEESSSAGEDTEATGNGTTESTSQHVTIQKRFSSAKLNLMW